MLFCGASRFSHNDEENDLAMPPAPLLRPRASKKKQSCSNENPYSSRGLDKFSEVMSELEAKRKMIMAKAAGSDKVSMVRFTYNNSDDWIPIIVRLQDDPPSKEVVAKKAIKKPQPVVPLLPQLEQLSDSEAVIATEDAEAERKLKTKKSFSSAGEECLRKWRPSYYWLWVMTVILVCMIMFGRVFAICCTTVWWYLAPAFIDTQENERQRQRLIKKKEFPPTVRNNKPLTQP